MAYIVTYESKLPVFFASVRCVQTGKVRVTKFLIDTGACVTCVPAYRAVEWGHCNTAPGVKQFSMPGLGCDWTGYLHSFKFGLADQRKLWLPPLWEAADSELVFVNNMAGQYGLLGMDIISQWKDLRIRPKTAGGGHVEITF